ncbi:MAG: InlB B-repeat-containing protein [Candidatus Nomurabacteria bacterium]|jgi:uncharacterized repeat protein (TIGR02543 family)|nr:InlB B-repeat-containing protein [Candidatus Nomurabacteria bacterium]
MKISKKFLAIKNGLVFATVLAVSALAVLSLININQNPARAAGSCAVAQTSDFATCWSNNVAETDIDITITADFNITSQVTIPVGKTVNLHSDATQRTLTRDASMVGTNDRPFEVAGTLNLSNITLDGDYPTVSALSPLVYVLNGGKININSGAILQNNFNNSVTAESNGDPSGGAVFVDVGGDGSINSDALVANNRARMGAGIMVKGHFNINGGEISDNYAERWASGTGWGGGVYIWGGSAEVEMTGGKITRNTANGGGGLEMKDSAIFRLSGGEISYNKVTDTRTGGAPTTGQWGWAIAMTNATLYMTGGKINNNTVDDGNFGTVSAQTGSTLHITGGEISHNQPTISTQGYGGGLTINGSTLNLGGDARIINNQAHYSGGVFMWNAATLNISGNAEISGNTGNQAGGIRVYDAASNATITGNVKITNNTGGTTGGGIHNTGTLSVDGATISDNEAGLDGGGIFNAGDLTVENTTIQGNTALASSVSEGGGIAHLKGSLTVKGSQILDNESGHAAGGMYVATKKDGVTGVLIEDTLIKNNQSLTYGGGVRVDAAATLNRVIIENNSSRYGGGFMTADGNFNTDPADQKPPINFDSVVFRGNSATFGGGIFTEDATITIRNSEITGNHATTSAGGGGTFNANTVLDFADSSVTNNDAAISGGGVRIGANAVVSNFDNITIAGNRAGTTGGGMYVATPNPTVSITGGSIVGNTAGTNGGGVYMADYNSLAVAANVEFRDNLAQYGTIFDLPTDSVNWAIYQSNILRPNDTWSYGLRYGYNNFDINYAQGDQVFAVQFDSRGGSSVPGELVAADGTALATEPANPTRGGYRFTGWFADSALSAPYDFSDPVAGNLVLFAGWEQLFVPVTPVVPGVPNTGVGR